MNHVFEETTQLYSCGLDAREEHVTGHDAGDGRVSSILVNELLQHRHVLLGLLPLCNGFLHNPPGKQFNMEKIITKIVFCQIKWILCAKVGQKMI